METCLSASYNDGQVLAELALSELKDVFGD
jgi:hypothetical protein